MLEVFSLLARIATNKDEFEREMGGLERRAGQGEGNINGSLNKLKVGFGIVAGAVAVVGTAVAGMTIAGVASADSFDKKMREVFTLLPGISEQSMGAMQEQTKALAIEMGKMPDEVVPALYQAISAGVPQENLFDFLRQANKTAVGGVTDLKTAVDSLTGSTNAYGLEQLSTQEASDTMFTAVRLGKTTISELGSSLGAVIPIASSAGVSFQEINAGVASLTLQGQTTSQAITGIKAAITGMIAPSSEAADLAGELGIEFNAAALEANGLGGMLDIISTATGGNTEQMATLFGSVEALNAMLALTSEGGAQKFDDALGAMNASAGATDEAFATMEKNAGASWEKIKVFFNVLLITIGEQVLPILQEWLSWVVERLPEMMDTFKVVLERVRGYISDFIEGFKSFLGDNEETVSAWRDRLAEFFGNVMESGSELFTTLVDLWQNVLKPAWAEIAPLVEQIFNGALTVIEWAVEAISIALRVLTDFLKGDWESAFSGALDFIENTWSGIVQLFKDFGLNAVAGFLEGFSSTWASVRTTIEDLGHSVIGWFTDVLGIESPSTVFAEIGVNLLQGLINGIVSLVSSVKDTVVGTANSVVGWFKDTFGVESPSTVLYAIGKFLLQGLKGGLSDSSALAEVTNKTKEVAGKVIDAFKIGMGLMDDPTSPASTVKAFFDGVGQAVNEHLPTLAAVWKRAGEIAKENFESGLGLAAGGVTTPGTPGFNPRDVNPSPDTTPTQPVTGGDNSPVPLPVPLPVISVTPLPTPGVTTPTAPGFTEHDINPSPDTTPTTLTTSAQGLATTFEELDLNVKNSSDNIRRREDAEETRAQQQGFFSQALGVFGNSLAQLAINNVPLVGTVLNNLAGGPLAVISAIFSELISKSEGFRNIIEKVNTFLEPIIATLGDLLTALFPIIDVALNLVQIGLAPLMWILENVVNPVFTFVANLIAGIWNAIANALNTVLKYFGLKLATIDLEKSRNGGETKEPTPDGLNPDPNGQPGKSEGGTATPITVPTPPKGGMFDETGSQGLPGIGSMAHYVVGVDANVMAGLLNPLVMAEQAQTGLLSSIFSGVSEAGNIYLEAATLDMASSTIFSNSVETLVERISSMERTLAQSYDGVLALS
jgi:TP901 family phage tail tape measure protein